MPRATWQDSRNTSAVWAKAIESSSEPDFVEPGAIPWLLLEVVGSEPEPDLGGPAHGDHLYPAGEYHRRPGAQQRL